jgi:hypothetical protein
MGYWMMKTFRAFFAAALLLVGTPAFAQWQTPNHSVPIGKGSGYQGFGAAVPGTAGQPFVSTGPTTDPAFGNIANSGFAAGAADTYKGSLNGTTVVDVPRAPCTAVNQALRYTAGVGESCGNIAVQTGYDMPINLGLSVPSPSGGALVINLTQANGSAPTSNNPVLVPFRSTALTTGTVTWSTISAPLSITVPSGATLGTSSNSGSCANGSTCPFRVWIFVEYNGGTPELGVATCSNTTTIFSCAAWESTLVTSTTISGSAGTAGTLYATTGVNLDAVRIIGYCDFSSGMATAGTWASSCTTLQMFGPGIPKPGAVVRTLYFTNSQATTGSGTTPTATHLTGAITPTSAANLIRAQAFGMLGGSSTGAAISSIYRGTSTAIGSQGIAGQSSQGAVPMYAFDAPGVVTSTSYTVYFWAAAGNGLWNAAAIPAALVLEEKQGALDKPANDNINPGIFSQTG